MAKPLACSLISTCLLHREAALAAEQKHNCLQAAGGGVKPVFSLTLPLVVCSDSTRAHQSGSQQTSDADISCSALPEAPDAPIVHMQGPRVFVSTRNSIVIMRAHHAASQGQVCGTAPLLHPLVLQRLRGSSALLRLPHQQLLQQHGPQWRLHHNLLQQS